MEYYLEEISEKHSISSDMTTNTTKKHLPIFCPTCVEKGLPTPKSDIFSEHVGLASLTAAFSAVHTHSHTYTWNVPDNRR